MTNNNSENKITFDVEIVDVYDITPKELYKIPKEQMSKNKSRKIGLSVHAYIAVYYDGIFVWDHDLRGIMAKKKDDDWFIVMPCAENYDKKSKSWIRFPCSNYPYGDNQKEFISLLKEKFVDFHKSWLIEQEEAKELKALSWKKRNEKNAATVMEMSKKRRQ